MRAAGRHIAIAALVLACAAAAVGTSLAAYSNTSSNVGSSFATASSYGDCPNTTVADGFVSGFETGRGGYALGTITLSSPAVVDGTAGAARTGGYALAVATSGTTGYGQWQWSVAPYPTTQVTRIAFRLNAQPTTDAELLTTNAGGSGALARVHYRQASNTLAVSMRRDASNPLTTVAGTTTVQIGTWHVLEVRYFVGGAAHTVDWRLDGTAQPAASVAATSTSMGSTQIGTRAAETVDVHYDDLLISRNSGDYPLGDGRVHAIRPNAMGASVNPANFQDDDGTAIDAASWQRLDEAPMTSLTDYVQQTTGAAGSYAELAFENTTQTCIRAAQATFSTHTAATNQTNNLKLSVFDGAAESIVLEGNMAANTAASRNYTATVTPATSWSQAAIDGLVARWGYGASSQDVTPLQPLDSVLVEYEAPQ